MTDKVQLNYPGFPDKVTPSTRQTFDANAAAALALAEAAQTDAECLTALQRWLSFFREGHMGVQLLTTAPTVDGDTSAAAIRRRFTASPARSVTEASARAQLDRVSADPIEGIWEVSGGNYRLAVLPDSAPKQWVAVVLRADSVWWMPGQVKAYITSTDSGYRFRYLMRDHSELAASGRVAGNVMQAVSGVSAAWMRDYPVRTSDAERTTYLESQNSATGLARLSDQTWVLHLPSFDQSQQPVIDSMLRANAQVLEAVPNLIIDVRNNGGGSDYVFAPVVPLMYTDPMTEVGVSILATSDNIHKFELLAGDTTVPTAQRKMLQSMVDQLRLGEGQLMRRNDNTLRMESRPYPRKVAVLMNRACASSCEQFLLLARQSRKLTLYGENSAGILDYANVFSLDAPGGAFRLTYPTSRSQRLPADPVDPAGIAPQVRMDPTAVHVLDMIRKKLEGA